MKKPRQEDQDRPLSRNQAPSSSSGPESQSRPTPEAAGPEITFVDLHNASVEEAVELLRLRIEWLKLHDPSDIVTMRNDGEFFYVRRAFPRKDD